MIQWGLREVCPAPQELLQSQLASISLGCHSLRSDARIAVISCAHLTSVCAGHCRDRVWRSNSLDCPVGADHPCNTGCHIRHRHGRAQHLASHGEHACHADCCCALLLKHKVSLSYRPKADDKQCKLCTTSSCGSPSEERSSMGYPHGN